jgi:hypothetical protein
MVQLLGDEESKMTQQHCKDANMEEVASRHNPVVGKQLSRSGLNTFIGIDDPGYQSEPEDRESNVRKVCK